MSKPLLHTPWIEPVRDADFGFGIWPWSKGPLWRLMEQWDFVVNNNDWQGRFTIPRGYLFDKASIPPLFWSFGYTPDGLCTVPALEHDFLCDLFQGGSPWLKDTLGILPVAPPAKVIHQHFRDALRRWGVRGFKEWTMWAGVRAFGPGGTFYLTSWFAKT